MLRGGVVKMSVARVGVELEDVAQMGVGEGQIGLTCEVWGGAGAAPCRQRTSCRLRSTSWTSS